MWLTLLLDSGGMVFEWLGEVQLGIKESCNACVVLYGELDYCWRTEDSWGGLMTESFNAGGTVITGDDNSLLFELISSLLKHRLSRGVFYGELDDCLPTEDSWGRFMTELFYEGETYVTGDDNSLLFEWLSLILEHRLSWGVVRCRPWFFPVTILLQRPILFGRGMMNSIWVCGGVVCLLFFLLMAIKMWDPTSWRYNWSHVWISVTWINLITSFFSQYNPNEALKYDLSEKGHYFLVHISYFKTNNNNK